MDMHMYQYQTSQRSRIARETHAFNMSLTLTRKTHPNLTQHITYVREKAWLRKARVVDPLTVALPTVYSPYIGDVKGAIDIIAPHRVRSYNIYEGAYRYRTRVRARAYVAK